MRKQIKILLAERDMTITDLAEELFMTQSAMSKQLIRNDFRVSQLKAIANVLNVELKVEFVQKNRD